MGNILDTPILDINSENLIHNNIHIQNMSIQGFRLHMEDFYSIYYYKKYLYVGIYDGHGGEYVSAYLRDNFLQYISTTINNLKLSNNLKSISRKINELFISFDKDIQKNIIFSKTQGSTAVCVALSNNNIIILNCGDSRAIVYNGRDVIYETTDFKPCNKKESKRIIKSGRRIIDNRIDGIINISRCFGDYNFKTTPSDYTHAIIALPEIKILDSKSCKFIVLLSDGITNVINSDDLCNYIEYNLQLNIQLSIITDNILKYCIYKQSTDNMTISIIVLYKYNFNNTLNDIELDELDIINKRVISELTINRNKYIPCNIRNIVNLIKSIDYNLHNSAGFRYNYIKSIYDKFIKNI
ncbi:protein phosphatase 1B [Choristoneura rosaceana entomopoxvirus 'L']|uniref:Protein phosphatase 1B n=1 Tax=Choristoneura rosaceana entomopoxvirus 'L' TaxID=1293539 RepID=A0ABM9QKF7_9POXV|nr:protein phosphatase 1B [Choristoneura rosaceana entomopoxvirus 'L']CCU56037.1 protein phosphatase 1B [Choristoneura rosaceana entomopoxvirus 'L']